MQVLPILVLASALVSACALKAADTASGLDQPSVQVFKSRGSVQCEGGGVTPDEMRTELSDAGVAVVASSCGTDGRFRAAMCGVGDGKLNLFSIPQSQVSKAESLGYRKLSELPGAREWPCR